MRGLTVTARRHTISHPEQSVIAVRVTHFSQSLTLAITKHE